MLARARRAPPVGSRSAYCLEDLHGFPNSLLLLFLAQIRHPHGLIISVPDNFKLLSDEFPEEFGMSLSSQTISEDRNFHPTTIKHIQKPPNTYTVTVFNCRQDR